MRRSAAKVKIWRDGGRANRDAAHRSQEGRLRRGGAAARRPAARQMGRRDLSRRRRASSTRVRNCLGYTGTYKGKPVSVQATGMGQPSLAIYVHELLTVYGVKTLIRVGTCGGLSEKVKLRDIVIAATASTDSAMNRDVFGHWQLRPGRRLRPAARRRRASPRSAASTGTSAASSRPTCSTIPTGAKVYDALRAHGVLAVEMETGDALHARRPPRRPRADRLRHDRFARHRRADRRRRAAVVAERDGRTGAGRGDHGVTAPLRRSLVNHCSQPLFAQTACRRSSTIVVKVVGTL